MTALAEVWCGGALPFVGHFVVPFCGSCCGFVGGTAGRAGLALAWKAAINWVDTLIMQQLDDEMLHWLPQANW